MAMWVFSSPAMAVLGGGGYPRVPLSITAHPCTLLCIPPCKPPQELRQNLERNAAWVAVIVLCLQQLLHFPNEILSLSISGNKSCSQQQGPVVQATTRVPAEGSSISPPQPAAAGTLSTHGRQDGAQNPCASIAFVPKLSPGHISAALQAVLGHTSLGTTRHCHH